MKRSDIKSVMLIGAGPIVIGQGCEFDYSGCQAIKALKGEGYRVILVNPNPATIMTDPEMADATYIEPISLEYLTAIIEKERPDALLPTLGGQTALNAAMDLARNGVLEKYNVEMIGANADAIDKAEDRNRFKEAMIKLGLDLPRSKSAHSMEEAIQVRNEIGSWPVIIRPGFTLGGTGGGIAHNEDEFAAIVRRGLDASLNTEVLIEESLIGWKEYEMEVMRDKAGNAVIVCSIENLDPMGVHTGDSITVAPIQTLTDREYQAMRDDSIAVLKEIGIETGGSNVQWAVHPETGRRIIIEMNPRVSRSSALASKATGFPIAKIAALLAVGYTLDELRNDITRETPSCFEPALDYVVVKVPRFTFEKFPMAEKKLGTQMKSVGEAMAIGRTFKEAYRKALRSLEVSNPLDLHDISSFDPWFKREIAEMDAFEKYLKSFGSLKAIPTDVFAQAKTMGFGDKEIGKLFEISEVDVRTYRYELGIHPSFGAVDTCAGEFKAITPYYYSTNACREEGVGCRGRCTKEDSIPASKKKIMILGGGPNRIGQGIEFDYCCCQAAFALKKRGFEVIMVNSNPETVSTDYDTSDKLYFEPLTLEDVMEIYEREKADGVIVQFGGQTPLNLAMKLKAAGANVIGTSPEDIDLAEDRDFFKRLVEEVGINEPPSGIAHSVEDAVKIAEEIGYPVLVRPSFVLGGRGMAIVYKEKYLRSFVEEAVKVAEGKPILIDKFLEHAIELDVDVVSDGETTVVGAILEHIEPAGCHSGDSASVTPPISLSEKIIDEVRAYAHEFAKRLNVCGLMNLQLAVKDNELWMIEVNPRASRTVPFVAKAIGEPLPGIAARCMAGEKLKDIGFTEEKKLTYSCVKEAVFPFAKFPGVDITLTPEMKSTGEVMAIHDSEHIAYVKSQIAAGSPLPLKGSVFLAIRDEDKKEAVKYAKELDKLGFTIYATRGTSTALWNEGVKSRAIYRVSEGRPNALDLIRSRTVSWIVNTNEYGAQAAVDDIRIRSSAVVAGIPVTTTLAGFESAVQGLAEENAAKLYQVVSLQERNLASR
ncbi:MAG: carbamoyl-phosphate synthase large subunit [Kiritimatiellae bacterium]|nr:carbamoyl-phosphate synthase large subunit [Kiritimatiellia bacterium]